MNLGYDIVVTVTGVVLVFAVLVLLMLIIMLEGKIFDLLDTKRNAKMKAAQLQEEEKRAAASPAQVASAAPEQPDVEEGIPGEVVAAIAAAIHALGGGKYTLRAVRRAGHGKGRGAWGSAGVADATEPF